MRRMEINKNIDVIIRDRRKRIFPALNLSMKPKNFKINGQKIFEKQPLENI